MSVFRNFTAQREELAVRQNRFGSIHVSVKYLSVLNHMGSAVADRDNVIERGFIGRERPSCEGTTIVLMVE